MSSSIAAVVAPVGRPSNDSPKLGGVANGIKLIQYRPAWSYHCLLRFRGIVYSTENAVLPISMGKSLPCIIDGNYVVNGQQGLEHIIDNTESNSNIIERDISNLEDFAYAAYIESHLSQVLSQMKNILKYDRHEILKSHSFITTWVLCIYRNIYSYFHQDNNQIVSYYDNSCVNYRYDSFQLIELESKLHRTYRVIDALLVKYNGYLSSSLQNRQHRGVADAVLFDHLTNIYLIENSKLYSKSILSVDEGVSKYEGIHSFYQAIAQEYFYNNNKAEDVQAVKILLKNQFLKHNNKLNGEFLCSWDRPDDSPEIARPQVDRVDEAVSYTSPFESTEIPEPGTTFKSRVYHHMGHIYLGVVVSMLAFSYIKSVKIR